MNELTIEQLLDKAINNENLTEKQWKRVVTYAEDNELAEVEGDVGRWTKLCIIVFPYKNKIYGVSYDVGLTECQDNDYAGCSIGEVHKVIKTIEDWEFV
jgi:hypothetical protein